MEGMEHLPRIHPELRPEDIPESFFVGGKEAHPNVVPLEARRRELEAPRAAHSASREDLQYKLRVLRAMRQEWECGIDAQPRWCVWGNDGAGKGVLSWITPRQGDELAAHRLAQIMRGLGFNARAEKTEWHEALAGKPVYKQ